MSEDIRPEVVQRIAQMLRDGIDTSGPAGIDAGAELAAADVDAELQRFDDARAADQSLSRRIRMREALAILTQGPGRTGSSWVACFDSLTADDLARLSVLYDVLPEPARAEYDRRYGQPGVAPEEIDGTNVA